MKILINGAQPVLKDNFSFEYVAENRLFLGRDGYSLTITFPLKDCPQNVAIFGHISRVDAPHNTLSFDCSIEDQDIKLFGSLIVVKISETEVECQFAEGRCEQSAVDTFEDAYINELDLGQYPKLTTEDCPYPSDAMKGLDGKMNAVALPWINEAYPTVPNNWMWYEVSGNGGSGMYRWWSEVKQLSWQPYLIYIAEQICAAIGYTCDFSAWRATPLKYLIICNTLPGSWDMPQFARALPHWTVSEFFEKLELFLAGEFDFDHRGKAVQFSFSKAVLAGIDPVRIEDSCLVDQFSSDISQAEDTKCDYIGSKTLVYKECGHNMANFYSCDWAVSPQRPRRVYDDLAALIQANKREDFETDRASYVRWGIKDPNNRFKYTLPGLMYAQDKQTYFVMRSIGVVPLDPKILNRYTQIYVLQALNEFGAGHVLDEENDNTEEIEFCPVCISDTYISESEDMGYMMYLSFSSMEEAAVDVSDTADDSTSLKYVSEIKQPPYAQAIMNGKPDDETSEYFDTIFIAYWDGTPPVMGKMPYPFIDPVTVTQDWKVVATKCPSLRLYNSEYSYTTSIPKIDPKQKYQFSWLSDTIPNPRSVFYIKGKRFVCEKITATFTKNGMSQLLKGVFYPVVEKEDPVT